MLVALGDRASALQSVGRAIEAGSKPKDLVEDEDLEPLRSDPVFAELTSDAAYLPILERRLTALASQLRVPRMDSPDDEQQEYTEGVERAMELTRELLDLSAIRRMPTRDRGDGVPIVDGSACEPGTRRILESLLQCGALWSAIPFLNLLHEYGIPNLTPEDARSELRL